MDRFGPPAMSAFFADLTLSSDGCCREGAA
jgi:hypothetical protein